MISFKMWAACLYHPIISAIPITNLRNEVILTPQFVLVFGFIMGAILGFVLSSSLAGTVFFFAQIERNTRSLLGRERFEEPTQYRADPRF
jgi:hypothetical protein